METRCYWKYWSYCCWGVPFLWILGVHRYRECLHQASPGTQISSFVAVIWAPMYYPIDGQVSEKPCYVCCWYSESQCTHLCLWVNNDVGIYFSVVTSVFSWVVRLEDDALALASDPDASTWIYSASLSDSLLWWMTDSVVMRCNFLCDGKIQPLGHSLLFWLASGPSCLDFTQFSWWLGLGLTLTLFFHVSCSLLLFLLCL